MADKEEPSPDQAQRGEQSVQSPLPILLVFLALLGIVILYGVFGD